MTSNQNLKNQEIKERIKRLETGVKIEAVVTGFFSLVFLYAATIGDNILLTLFYISLGLLFLYGTAKLYLNKRKIAMDKFIEDEKQEVKKEFFKKW